MKVSKVVLAYSGGLDTSVICRWLQETYGADVVTFTADIGQGNEVEPARAKAEAMDVSEIHIEDLKETFVRDYVFPMFRANALYEGEYLLGTSIARPLIARRLVEIAADTGADAIAHGATGKGNDQVRFELGAYALNPDIKVIAPWREWALNSREALLDYCRQHRIPVDFERQDESPYSMDANLLHISYEGGGLEDPWKAPDNDMWRWTVAPESAPDEPRLLEIEFDTGDAVALDGEPMSPARLARDDGGEPVGLVEPRQEFQELAAGRVVEVSRGLVGDQERRVAGERPGDCHPLLLAAAQFLGAMAEPVTEAQLAQQFRRPRLGGGAGHPADAQGERSVFDRGQFGEQPVVLEHEPHVPVAKRRGFAFGQLRHLLARQPERAGVGPVERPQDVQQRRLPHPAAAGDRHHLAFPHLQIELAEHRDAAGPGAEGLVEAPGFELQRHWKRSASVTTSDAARRAG